MSRGSEDHLLVGVAGVGHKVVVGADDGVDVDEVFREGRLSGARVGHGHILPSFRLASGEVVDTFSASVEIVDGLSARSAPCRSLSFDRMAL